MIDSATHSTITIAVDALQPPPSTSQDGIVPFIEGLAAIDDTMVMILDLAKLSADEVIAEAA